MKSRRMNAVVTGLLVTTACGTLIACAQPETPLHRDYVLCADNATDCGENVIVTVNENTSAETPD